MCNNHINGQSRFLTVCFRSLFEIYNCVYKRRFQAYKLTNFIVIVLFVFRTPFVVVRDVTSFSDFARTSLLLLHMYATYEIGATGSSQNSFETTVVAQLYFS